MIQGRTPLLASLLSFVLAAGVPTHLQAEDDANDDAFELALSGWDLPAARRLADGAATSTAARLRLGLVAVYEAEYATAEALLTAVLADPGLGVRERNDAEHHLALARGAQRALGEAIVVRSGDGSVEAVFAHRKDVLLAPYLFEAMAAARRELDPLLGVTPDHRIRFEFLDNPAKLAMVTPLSVDNIRTTGTVGVTKYRRVMMITPRVMLHGYGWLDTAVHEYVHYLLTMRTHNQAPVWLQEGLAKLLETRWRRNTAPPLEPGVAYRLHNAIVRDELVELEEMYPSVAMLPSAELASLAYAEVETMLGLLHERRGSAGLARLLDVVDDGRSAEAALAEAWGASFDDFMTAWKRTTRARTRQAEAAEIRSPRFADEADPAGPAPLGDVFSHLGGGRARQFARLGALLEARDHPRAAVLEYERARKADPRASDDPALCRRLGRMYVDLGHDEAAIPVLEIAAQSEPEDANLAADQGRALLRVGRHAEAKAALDRAIRVNPFIPAIHCDLAELAADEETRARELLSCDEMPASTP